jgi:selenocysteine-specific translation elongation factor
MSLVNFYKIVCNNSGLIYVGSTILPIERRLKQHEYNYRYYLENKNCFVTSFLIIEKNNYSVYLINSVQCIDKKQRNIIEALYILNESSVNKIQPGRDKKQYRQDNKEHIKENMKQYRQDNKENMKQYRQDNKEKIKQYRQDNKENMKQYRQDNKENMKQYIKQWHDNNKEHIKQYKKQWHDNNKEKLKEKFTCPCGGKYTFTNRTRHMKSAKHINYLSTL